MAHGRVRVWVKRAGLAAGLLAVAAGGYAALNWAGVSARYAGYRFRTAATDNDRDRWAAKLVALGDAGTPYLLAPFRTGDEAGCDAAIAAVRGGLADLPPTDPRYAARCRAFLDGFGSFADAGKAAAIRLVPELLKSPDPDAAARCRDAVRAGLAAATTDGKVQAVRLALRPEIGLRADVAPLLDDPEAEVRRAAMLAVGPAPEGAHPVIDDEELFRWLHDPDPEVRDLCEAALYSRGLDALQVQLARQLTAPEAAERLRLLVDLQWAGEAVRDPGPWLERLSRDPDPAVRLGAARVAVERRLLFAGWLDRMADADPDPTVRRWAGYYRGLSAAVRQTGFDPGR
jgi:hypothetical protein